MMHCPTPPTTTGLAVIVGGAGWVAELLIIPSISNLINLDVTPLPTCQRRIADLPPHLRGWQEEMEEEKETDGELVAFTVLTYAIKL